MQLLLSLRLILMSKIMDVKTQKPTTERILVVAATDNPLDLGNVNTIKYRDIKSSQFNPAAEEDSTLGCVITPSR